MWFKDLILGTEDDATQWSLNVDKINNEIANRMRAQGILHEAAGKDKVVEQTYFREIVNQFIIILEGSKYNFFPQNGKCGTESKILKTLIREWTVCKIYWPMFSRFSTPHYLNRLVLEVTNSRLAFQRSAKAFRYSLDTSFTLFSPQFLFQNASVPNFHTLSYGLKFKYLDYISRCMKRITSAIDLSTLNFEILHEIKRTQDKLAEIEQNESSQTGIETLKSLNALQLLRNKLSRKILSLAEDSGYKNIKFKLHRAKTEVDQRLALEDNSAAYSVTLTAILDEYFKTTNSDISGPIKSPAVFHFLKFIGNQSDFKISAAKLRFWLVAESYRQLVWRLGNGVVSNDAAKYWDRASEPNKIDILSLESHSRLRNEAHQIYVENMAPINVLFPSTILNSFERYIAPLLAPGSVCLDDDYLCVVKAQTIITNDLNSYFSKFLHSDAYFKVCIMYNLYSVSVKWKG
jgi:hypothetical protein